VYGRLISKDFKTAIIIASTFIKQDLTVVHDQIAQAMAPYRSAVTGTQLTVLGDPEINYQLNASMEKEAVLFAALSLLIMLLAIALIFRSWQGVLLTSICMVLSIVWTMGLVGFYGEAITLLSATIPVAIVVMGSSNAIHIFYHLEREFRHASSMVEAFELTLRKVFSPLMMAMITTFIGSITLLSFRIRPLQHFGIFTAWGSLLSLVVCYLVVFSLFKLFTKSLQVSNKRRKGHETLVNAGAHAKEIASETLSHIPVAGGVAMAVAESLGGALKGSLTGFFKGLKTKKLLDDILIAIAKTSSQHPLKIISATALILAVALFYSKKVEIGFDNLDYFPKKNEVRAAAQRVDDTFGGTKSFEFMIDTGQENGIVSPILIQKIDSFEARVKKEVPEVSQTYSVVHMIKKIHEVMGSQKGTRGEKALLPQNRDMIAQYLLLIGMSGSSAQLENLLTSDYRKTKLTLTLNMRNTTGAEGLYDRINAISKDHFGPNVKIAIGGQLMNWIALMRYLVWGKVQNILSCVLTIFLLIMVWYRSIVRGLLTVLPLPIAVIITFGLMGWAGIKLDFITAIITSFSMGFSVDFCIHFISALRRSFKTHTNMEEAIEKAITGPGRAIVYNVICCVLGFGVLIFSQFQVLSFFAILMSVNMITVLLATFLVVPAVSRLCNPQFVTNECTIQSVLGRKMLMASKVAFSCLVIVVLTWGMWIAEAHSATTPDQAKEIIDKSLKAARSQNEESEYVMRLVGREGEEGVRKMRVWYKTKNDENFSLLIKFSEPANIRGTGLLSVVEKGKDPSQWLYMPALKKTRRITGGSSSESFLGSDFSIGDISVDPHNRFKFKVTGSTKCGDSDCHLLEGTPQNDGPYSKKIMQVRKDNYLNVRTEFFNKAGQLEKVMTLGGMYQAPDKRWWAKQVEMSNVLNNHKTVIEYEKRDMTKVPSDSVFTKAFLEKN